MSTSSLIARQLSAVCVHIAGRVQGLGVRPAAARLATRLSLSGSVANTADGLTLELSGDPAAIEQFLTEFPEALPAGAVIERMNVNSCAPAAGTGFRIAQSTAGGTGSAAVPLDRIVCTACLAELRDASDRRSHYAFTSCTDCGPRYSIVERMPYDRSVTAMRQFAACPACEAEYRCPGDRRFHAQANACPDCGPQMRWLDAAGRTLIGQAALNAASHEIRAGRIVALKGLGGYQLLADATSTAAVQRLRVRKRRQTKPMAVLVQSVEAADQIARLNDAERQLLCEPAGPIVVVLRRADALLSPEVAPGFDSIGLLLPTTPLHALLCESVGRPLVCTSGNLEGEPLVYEQAAEQQLQGIADGWLHHARPIVRPVDDSVVRVIADTTCVLRLARGYAPHGLDIAASHSSRQLVALGGQQKSAFALWNGSQAVLGPHIGDLTRTATCQRWAAQLYALGELYGVPVSGAQIVHDAHPDYFSSHFAQQFCSRQAVQHHHAHVAAVMLEHRLLDREVLGLAWDGTGYGADGTIWGGECLRTTSRDFQRIAWLRPFPLLGGEQAVRQPWRVAIGLVNEAMGSLTAAKLAWTSVTAAHTIALLGLAARPQRSLKTSSMGRLFDAVASLTLDLATADDEARPAMLLEQLCDRTANGSYQLPWDRTTGQIDWRPMIAAVVRDLQSGAPPGSIAMRFHRAVADLAYLLAAAHPHLPLIASGGVFQNAVLGELLAERFANRRAGYFRGTMIPIGDGGLAAGQLAVAAARGQHD